MKRGRSRIFNSLLMLRPVAVTNREGVTVFTIDSAGQLWRRGMPVKEPLDAGLIEDGTRTALDGSKVTDFHRGAIHLQRFTKDGKSWWASAERLCGLRDVDEARNLALNYGPAGGALHPDSRTSPPASRRRS